MKQIKNITTLIFDFGGVLINLDLSACVQAFKLLGVSEISNYLSNYGQAGFFMKFEKGEIGVQEFRDEIRKLSIANLTDNQIDTAWNAFLLEIPQEKLDLIEKLRKKYRVLLLSNTNLIHIESGAAQEFAKRSRTIYDYFDKCYFSYKMKMVKPDAEIFTSLLQEEDVKPENCLFLDDGPKNIATAQSLGIHSYLVDPKESLDFLLTDVFP